MGQLSIDFPNDKRRNNVPSLPSFISGLSTSTEKSSLAKLAFATCLVESRKQIETIQTNVEYGEFITLSPKVKVPAIPKIRRKNARGGWDSD